MQKIFSLKFEYFSISLYGAHRLKMTTTIHPPSQKIARYIYMYIDIPTRLTNEGF